MALKARQRQALAAGGLARVLAWNAGLLLLWSGLATASWWLIAPGMLLFGIAALGSLTLLARALVMGLGVRDAALSPRS